MLVALDFISENALRDTLSESQGKASIELTCATIDAATLQLVPHELARRHHLLPLHYDPSQQRLTIAVRDGDDLVALDAITALHGGHLDIETLLAGETDIDRAIDRAYGHELAIDGILHELETGETDARVRHAAPEQSKQPIIRLIDAILTDAVRQDASDIHFEPEPGFLRIRYRIDGLLKQIRSVHKTHWPAMNVRLKVLAGMNIAETRAPQDGHIPFSMQGRQIDLRASVQPTLHGENIVLRILDRRRGLPSLDELGLTQHHRRDIERMMARPEGIILVTGPTGSGKTTTLYSMLRQVNDETINIMTLEDPVELPMPIVRQTSVAEAVRLDFANGIRSIMRQDPDIILVGEIRDSETAEMAFRAAMTGHQVYATLHANSALGAIPRLLDIGIPPDILAENIIGIIAQRLVRRLCDDCKTPYPASAAEARLFEQEQTLFRPTGCKRCQFRGYRGRFALMEILRMTDVLAEHVARRATVGKIRRLAETHEFSTLAEEGLRRVRDGTTSLVELGRVLDLTQLRSA
ncbi:GspE/PulE family protein [Propionivibrio dicarboxylicus]|uniref:General secretion pathway protein E n=1 Tax=Propionivibrio dicarboxylicus TaxID=83767 RepID=A0A1G8FT85_9RHOO|nr:general secretion pathway protein E [Propionivibrio dicarboxylicus]